MRITARTLCGTALGVTFAACADPAASGITAPAQPAAYKVAGQHDAPEPKPGSVIVRAAFIIDDEARFDSARFAVDFAPSASPVGAFATVPRAFNDPDLWSPGASMRFHSDGSLTGTGTLTITLPVLPSRTAGPVAVIDLQRMLESDQSELDPYCFARNPFFNRPFGICARVRVLDVPVYDTPASHPRFVSGTIFISGDSIVEGR